MGLEASKRTKVLPGVTANKTARARAGSGKAAPAKKKGSWTLSLGFWSYNTSTGQHTFKLGKTLKYKSKTRTQRAAKKKAKAAATQAERARLATYFAEQTAAVPVHHSRTTRRRGETEEQFLRRGRSEAYATAQQDETRRRANFAAPRLNPEPQNPTQPFAQHQQAMRAAGACGARTADGTGCARRGHCPYHSRGN